MLLLVGSLNQVSCLSVVHAIKFQQTLLCLFLLQEIGNVGEKPKLPLKYQISKHYMHCHSEFFCSLGPDLPLYQ